MSESDLPIIQVYNNEHLYIGDNPLYVCEIHRLEETVQLPFYVEGEIYWGDDGAATWICQWKPVLYKRDANDPEVNNDLSYTEEPRKHKKEEPSEIQATYKHLQLYIYLKDKNPAAPQGEVAGFWTLATKTMPPHKAPYHTAQPTTPRGP